MAKELPAITLLAGQTVRITGPKPLEYHADKSKSAVRVTAPGTYVDPTPPPPVDPPPTTGGIFGPGIAADGKDNRPVGRSDDSHYAVRWHSKGGQITSVAFNQRFGPPNAANPGQGYSNGDGGLMDLSIQGVKADGTPNGVKGHQQTLQPYNPYAHGFTGDGAEDRKPIPFPTPNFPEGDYCLVWDNIDPDPTHNWMSLNCLFNPQGKPQPGTDAVVLERTNATNDQWRVKADNTPTFQVTFADGHTEGQGYGSIIANTDLDGSNQYSGFAMTGNRAVRQKLVVPTSLSVKAAWLRVKRLSGGGNLMAQIGGQTGFADISTIPPTAKADLNGSEWVRVPLVRVIPAGPLTVTFWTSATLDVMPIRKDGFEQDGWLIPNNGGWAEKSMDGSSWSDLYSRGTDLQMYLELA